MKKLIITFIIVIFSVGQVFSHSVQVQYYVSCNGFNYGEIDNKLILQ